MKTLIHNSIWIFAFFIYSSTWCQESPNPVGIPASPNAASLGQYAEVPVSKFSGIANISIPIYTITDGDLSLPINLNYHGGGVKVDAIASWVGSGWSLNAGGMISRQVVGGPDEGGYSNQPLSDMSGWGWYRDGGVPQELIDNMSDANHNVCNNTVDPPCAPWRRFTDAANGNIDTEPDIFTYNFNGTSGKFYFDENRNIHTVPESDLKIIPGNNPLTNSGEIPPSSISFDEWIIITPDGTKYFFGSTDATEYTQNYPNGVTCTDVSKTTTWFLKKIENANGTHFIAFEYEDETSEYYSIPEHTVTFGGYPGGRTYFEGNFTKLTGVFSKTINYGKRLSRIYTSISGVDIFFEADTLRQDLRGDSKRLDEININVNSYCTKFKLSYNYLIAPQSTRWRTAPGLGTEQDDLHRLMLASVQQFTCDESSSLPGYIFDYNEGPIPSRYSLGRDHWGFPNGADSNEGLLPRYMPPGCVSGIAYRHGNANKRASAFHLLPGSLKRITYPLGGNVAFTYEPNQALSKIVGGLRVKEINYNFVSSTSKRVEFNYLEHLLTVTDNPKNYYQSSSYYAPSLINTNIPCTYSSNLVPYTGSSISNHIVYPLVETKYSDGGSTKEYFKFPANYFYEHTVQDFPKVPMNTGIETSTMYRIDHFDASGAMVYSQEDQYEFLGSQKNTQAMKVGTLPCLGNEYGCIYLSGNQALVPKLYDQKTQRYLPTLKTETMDGVTKTTSYAYNVDVHNNPISTTFTNSDGKEIKTETVFALDNDPDIDIPSQMVDRNMIGIPIATRQYIDGTLYSGVKTVFDFGQGCSSCILPKEVFVIKGAHGWDRAYTINSYNSQGRPLSVQREYYSAPDTYQWSDDLLTNKTYLTHSTSYDYYFTSHRKLKEVTAIDGLKTNYVYDPFLRLKDAVEYSGNRTTSHTYVLGGPSNNYVQKSTSFADQPTRTEQNFVDGLGRDLRTVKLDYDPSGGDVVTMEYFYENVGRIDKKTYLPKSLISYKYEHSPLSRPLEEIYPDGASVKSTFGSNGSFTVGSTTYGPNSCYVTFGLDENDNPTNTYTDKMGRTIMVETAIGQTKYEYDNYNNISKIHTPEELMYSYSYDVKNRLQTKSVPGGGTTTYTHNQRDLQATLVDANGKLSTFVYDEYDRMDLTTIDGKNIDYTYGSGGIEIDKLIEVSTDLMDAGNSLIETIGYDPYGRPNTRSKSTVVGSDQYTMDHYFTDQQKWETRAHTGLESVQTQATNTYDNWGRHTSLLFAVGDLAAKVQKNKYNYRDELIKKVLSGPDGAAYQVQAYKYHIRGWLTDINEITAGAEQKSLEYCETHDSIDVPDLFENSNNETNLVDLQEIVDRRFDEDFVIGDHQRCTDLPCDSLPCDSASRFSQIQSLAEVLDTMRSTLTIEETTPCEGTSLTTIIKGAPTSEIVPSKILLLKLCDGSLFYILEPYLSIMTGQYEILQEIPITDINQDFLVSHEGSQGQMSLAGILPLIAAGESFTLDGYTACSQEECQEPEKPACDSATTLIQTSYIDSLAEANRTLNVAALTYPLDLVKVLLCSGEEVYLFQSEIDEMPGSFVALHEETIDDPDQQIEIQEEPSILANGALFREKIYYDKASQTLEGPIQRNGNISHLYWQVAGRTPKGYGYKYDAIDRMLKATYGEVKGSGSVDQIIKSDAYSVYGISYDKDGNLETLTRNGPITSCPSGTSFGIIDQLQYTIENNRMTALADAGTRDGYFPGLGTSYGYDGAGNTVSVAAKGLSITNNALNLPETATLSAGSMKWDYTADGQKVKFEGLVDTKQYADGIEYVNNDIYIYHPEGRVYKDSTGEWLFEYSLKDHLGNTRVVFADVDRDGVIVDTVDVLHEAHYYPFGMEMDGMWNRDRDTLQPYLYNGKELHVDSTDIDGDGIRELALGWYDYGARFYDPAIARWTSTDPQAERYSNITPYAYVANMPTIAIDPNGEEIIIVNNGNAQQVIQDLGKIYATRRGRALINRLASSNTKYYIDGSANSIRGGLFHGTRYNRLTNTLTYTQKTKFVDGVYNPSYITLGHELFHAYQDETNAKRNYPKQTEADAMKFENYLRDVFDQGPHRTKHGGVPHLSSVTAFSSNGEKVDVNSVSVTTYIFGGSKDDGEGGMPRDNIDNGTSIAPIMTRILQYMDNNGIQKLTLNFNQWDKDKNKP